MDLMIKAATSSRCLNSITARFSTCDIFKITKHSMLISKPGSNSRSCFITGSTFIRARASKNIWENATRRTKHTVNGIGTEYRKASFSENKAPNFSSIDESKMIKGEVLDLAVDLRSTRPGDRIDIPYELTISESMQVSSWILLCTIFWWSTKQFTGCYLNSVKIT